MKNKHPIRHFFTNIVCGLIANKSRRKKVRVILNSDMRRVVRFIRRDLAGARLRKIRTEIGYGAQNLIVIANDTWVYKFPLCKSNPNEIALREKRIVDAFARVSSIYVPPVELLDFDGVYVRKYEYIRGRTFGQMKEPEIKANMDAWSDTVAEFLHTLATSDPVELSDLKPTNATRPKPFYGWCHGDFAGNFMINATAHKIIAMIDWEDCRYGDFASDNMWTSSLPHGTEFLHMVRDKYLKLCGGK